MKEGWKYMKLGEIVVFDKRFKGVPKEQQKQIVSFKHVSAETLKGLLVDNGDVKLLATGLFTGYTTQELAGNNLNSGEVISFPTGGNANIKYHKGNFVDSGNILCVAKDDSIYLKYVHFGLLYQNDYIESCYKGTGIHHPFMPDIWDVKVPIPDISTQYSIVARLDAEFAKIEALKANAEKQLQAAKDLFQAALDSFFCIKYNKPLEMLVNIINGFAFKSEDFKKEAELKVIKITNVGVGNFIEDDSRINKIYGNLDIAKVYKNDIVVALTRTIIAGGLKVAIVPLSYNEALLNQRVACLRENGTSSIRYIYYYLSSNSAIKYVQNKVNTLMQPNLSIVDLKAMPIPYLEMDKQNNIADHLDTLSAKIKQLEKNCNETITLCNDLKQSLLKKIFE